MEDVVTMPQATSATFKLLGVQESNLWVKLTTFGLLKVQVI